MMKKKKIKVIVKNQIKNLQYKFNKIVTNFNAEDIPQFRLEYNKLKAFFTYEKDFKKRGYR